MPRYTASTRAPKLPRPAIPERKGPLPNTISIPSPLLTREGVLKELEKLGKTLALEANPQHYSYEDRSRAQYYVPRHAATQRAWAAIHQNHDIPQTLAWLATILDTGLERNRLNLITIAATQGFGPHHWWTVKDDAIVPSHPL